MGAQRQFLRSTAMLIRQRSMCRMEIINPASELYSSAGASGLKTTSLNFHTSSQVLKGGRGTVPKETSKASFGPIPDDDYSHAFKFKNNANKNKNTNKNKNEKSNDSGNKANESEKGLFKTLVDNRKENMKQIPYPHKVFFFLFSGTIAYLFFSLDQKKGTQQAKAVKEEIAKMESDPAYARRQRLKKIGFSESDVYFEDLLINKNNNNVLDIDSLDISTPLSFLPSNGYWRAIYEEGENTGSSEYQISFYLPRSENGELEGPTLRTSIPFDGKGRDQDGEFVVTEGLFNRETNLLAWKEVTYDDVHGEDLYVEVVAKWLKPISSDSDLNSDPDAGTLLSDGSNRNEDADERTDKRECIKGEYRAGTGVSGDLEIFFVGKKKSLND